MAKPSVRCAQCGAKNGESLEERCRICGFLLPDFHRRRLAAAGAHDGLSFAAAVEEEVGAWQDYGTNGVAKRRRVFDDPNETDSSPLTIIVALVIAAIIVMGAAQLLIAA